MPRSHKTLRPPEFPNHQSLVTSYHLWKFPIDDLRHHALHIPVAVKAVQREPGGKLFHLFKGAAVSIWTSPRMKAFTSAKESFQPS